MCSLLCGVFLSVDRYSLCDDRCFFVRGCCVLFVVWWLLCDVCRLSSDVRCLVSVGWLFVVSCPLFLVACSLCLVVSDVCCLLFVFRCVLLRVCVLFLVCLLFVVWCLLIVVCCSYGVRCALSVARWSLFVGVCYVLLRVS